MASLPTSTDRTVRARQQLVNFGVVSLGRVLGESPHELLSLRCECGQPDCRLRVEEIRRDPDGGGEVEGMALIGEATFKAMQGRFEEARQEMMAGRSIYRELGFALHWAGSAMLSGRVELLAGDPAGAERELREGYETLERLGETGYLSTVVALLAEAARAQGRLEEAVQLSEASERASAPDDFDSQATWRNVRARALAQQGALAEAERLARESVALLEPTDFLVNRAESHSALADVLRLCGRPEEAAAALEEALRLYQRKGDLVSVARTSTLLDELGTTNSARSSPVRGPDWPGK